MTTTIGDPIMNAVRILTLLLALSVAVNVAFAAGITARLAGVAAGHPDWRRGRRDRHGHLLRCSRRLPLITVVRRHALLRRLIQAG